MEPNNYDQWRGRGANYYRDQARYRKQEIKQDIDNNMSISHHQNGNRYYGNQWQQPSHWQANQHQHQQSGDGYYDQYPQNWHQNNKNGFKKQNNYSHHNNYNQYQGRQYSYDQRNNYQGKNRQQQQWTQPVANKVQIQPVDPQYNYFPSDQSWSSNNVQQKSQSSIMRPKQPSFVPKQPSLMQNGPRQHEKSSSKIHIENPFQVDSSISEIHAHDESMYSVSIEEQYSVYNEEHNWHEQAGMGQIGRYGQVENEGKPKKKKKKKKANKTPPIPQMPKGPSQSEMVSNEVLSTPNVTQVDYAVCPFNYSHIMPKRRLQTHIQKCKLSENCIGYVQCRYNPVHWQRADNIKAHEATCESKEPNYNFQMNSILHNNEDSMNISKALSESVNNGNDILSELCRSEFQRKVVPEKQEYEDDILDGDF